MRIAVDAMGGDLGPAEVALGVAQAAASIATGDHLILVGDKPTLEQAISDSPTDVRGRITIVHASQTLEMTDKPREVYRRKPDSSVVVSARLVKEGEADGFISIGNTGAAMASAIFLLRPIPGIDRPAIATPLPSLAGQVVLLDAGANVDCTPRQILDFAVMGEVYARTVLDKAHPTIGLLSNGEEESKGNELTKQAHQLLKHNLDAFCGNIEGRDVFRGKVNVVVCDGFDGNILLKTGEGVAEMVMTMVKDELLRYKWMKLFLLPLRKGMRDLRMRIDPSEFGGAPLLGVNGLCIIGHGRSDARAIVNAVRVAQSALRHNLVGEIGKSVAAMRSKMQTSAPSVDATPDEGKVIQ
jgi:glycerol-3-phosphate acyltransferase PlsX